MAAALATVDELVLIARPRFESMLVDKSMNFAAEAEFAIQQICRNKYSVDLARQNPQAVHDAMVNVSGMGLTLNPALALAYLAPRDKKIQLLVSYRGLLHVAVSSGSIRMAKAELVHANDRFVPQGLDEQPLHEFSPFAKPDVRGELVGVYVSAKTVHGDWVTEWMTTEQVHAVRERSDSWKAYWATRDEAKPKSTPWNTDEGEMFKKTVIRRAYKSWPISERLGKVMEHLNASGEGVTLSNKPVQDEEPSELLLAARAAADKGRDAFSTYWKALKPAERSALRGDIEDLAQRTAEADEKRTVPSGAEPAAQTPTPAPAATTPDAVTDVEARPVRKRAPAPVPTSTGTPSFTAERIAQRLRDAADLDALQIAADLIRHVPDKGAVAQLEAFCEERQAELLQQPA
ncbi:recombinase RecT [Variovorax sp. PAMC26660]|uniref:recombinase RecT n=1 Tax=Variovorax sp. PAMC26660 TaxID=2762322 RepID=UPI00164E47A9|nr:recombinase RecT [Variovorax sp. PAMC26660]QNK66065.1 recombinase RecT [Variovorax sp. PAMC26660]